MRAKKNNATKITRKDINCEQLKRVHKGLKKPVVTKNSQRERTQVTGRRLIWRHSSAMSLRENYRSREHTNFTDMK